jgi:hypothetical protein
MSDVDGAQELVQTPEAFLKALAAGLQEKEGIDTDLADILRIHILKSAPAQNAVAQAKEAILKLADKRANAPKPEVSDG